MEELKLPNNIRKIIGKFTGSLKDIYGDELVSVVLYGSAASGEFTGTHSNINLAIVLKEASVRSIKKAAQLVKKRKYSIINPIFFTEKYISGSLDVFPIEFLDIKENHFLLHGRDIFNDLRVDLRNLGFQCEQELKSKILNIKKLYLKADSKSFLKSLLFKSITSSLHILRNIIRLKGKAPPYRKEAILDEISRELTVDCSGLKRILDAKNNNLRLKTEEIDELFTQLIDTLESISDKLDRI